MSILKIAVAGTDYYTEQTTTQIPISAGASGTFSAANNIATITTTSAHGLTFSPSAGTLPNYFVQFGGTTSGLTGTGILVGNNFRILSIPSTTTFTIYTTVTAATVTSMTIIPVFFPTFIAALLSGAATNNVVNSTTGAFGVSGNYPNYGSCFANLVLGSNLSGVYGATNSGTPWLDATTGNTPSVGNGVTGTSAGQNRVGLGSAFGGIMNQRFGPQDYLIASGTSGTSYISIIN